jgi:hypothetical protein
MAPPPMKRRFPAWPMGLPSGPPAALIKTFVGELIELAGMAYCALDGAKGFQTTIFDLNSEILDSSLIASFDLVLNFSTTEHVMNQHNAMRVVHDAVKAGGHIVHEVPC